MKKPNDGRPKLDFEVKKSFLINWDKLKKKRLAKTKKRMYESTHKPIRIFKWIFKWF